MPHRAKPDVDTMKRRVVTRLSSFGMLEPAEIAHLAAMGGDVRVMERGEVILEDENRGDRLELLLDGWAASAVELASGARQLVTINLPGDLLGIPSLGVRTPLDSVIALSPVILCRIEPSSVWELFENWPKLAIRLFRIAQEERVMAMERLALVGKAPALSRVAAMFVRLGERLERLQIGTLKSYEIPLTQKDMADLVGVTSVHFNGLLRDLREGGLISLDHHSLEILDEARLRKLAQVDPWQFSPWPDEPLAGVP